LLFLCYEEGGGRTKISTILSPYLWILFYETFSMKISQKKLLLGLLLGLNFRAIDIQTPLIFNESQSQIPTAQIFNKAYQTNDFVNSFDSLEVKEMRIFTLNLSLKFPFISLFDEFLYGNYLA
jgi:hypothetical protein